jgi:hypothetical protein
METEWAQTDDYPGNTEQYGYGLYLHEGYVNRVWHEGNLPGYQSSIYMVPAQNWAVIVFFNSSSGDPNNVSQFAVDTFLLPSSVKSPALTTPPSTWTRYEGTYVDPYGTYTQPAGLGTIQVSLQGSDLFAEWNGQTPPPGSAPPQPPIGLWMGTQLTQVAGDRFQGTFGSGGTQDVTFFPGDGGSPAWFVTRIGVGARQ